MLRFIIDEAKNIFQKDPAAKSLLECIFLYPSLKVLVYHKIAHKLYLRNRLSLARAISQWARKKTGIEIHPGARIGKHLFIDHGMGVVIGETAEIGDNCTIYHGVTLGGTGKEKGKRHPTIGNNVLISAGAKVLGPLNVGDNSRIGANAVVLKDVPADTTVVGVPGRAVRWRGTKIAPSIELDQVHIPDPVAQEIRKLIERMEKIEKHIMEQEVNDELKEE